MADIEIKRGYEVLPDNNVRFGVRVINSSDAAILDVEVILDFNASLFELEGGKLQNFGTIPPAGQRTAKFILKPRGCIHKEEIAATVRYKDPQWNRHSLEMRPKEVHCVCPFLKEKAITRADFLALAASGYGEERGINFEAITIDKLIAFLLHTCQNRLYRVDDVSVEQGRILYLAADAVGEKAYYLLTAVVVEQEGIIQVLLRASSDKRHGLTGFLNELMENLRHLVSSVAHAREIGVIKQEQVINIIDSVVQRTTFAAAGGEGAPSVTIKDSVVQRTEIKADEEAKRRRREEEERERLQREEARKEQEKKAREEQERLRKEEEEKKERERKAKEEVEKRKREQAEQKARQEAERLKLEQEERLKREQAEQERLRREEQEKKAREIKAREAVKPPEAEKGTSRTKIFAVIIVLGAALLGYWGFIALSQNDAQTGPPAALPTQTPTLTPSSSPTPAVTPAPTPAVTRGNTFTNSIGMEFVSIPAGAFEMGSPSNDADRYDDEGPVHQVTIKKAFYMGSYEVTQAQWRAVMGDNPSYYTGDDDLPVETVSWDDVQEFIKKLNAKEGTDKYRLPSEAEWEYACRAGTTTRYSFGDSDSKLGEYAWYYDNSGSKTHPVGQKKPNPWGLYDMHGNIWEWVQDTYHSDYNGAPADGSAWAGSGADRVNRGGSWSSYARYCRSAIRYFDARGRRNRDLGFRLVREV
jgi:formylglycine-generating enzyme required for sulfatase activity